MIKNKQLKKCYKLINESIINMEKINNEMIKEITELVNNTRKNLVEEINKSIIYVYWNIGKIIVSNENEHNNRLNMVKKY